MITSINKENAGRYQVLFQNATTALRENGKMGADWAITDLEGYFSAIKELLAIDKKYTILPLDESYFSIDANSRVITVPQDFKKNGIAVQGDEVAEIVYFKINRYFDFMDLNNADIYIQWERNGVDGKTVTGVSTEWVRDITSDPDYLIFGWPLSSDVTEVAGPIKFSVRFIQWYNDPVTKTNKVQYSFSTLESQATINPALDLDDDKLVVNPSINQMIADRLENTQPTGGKIATEPKFKVNLVAEEVDLVNDEYVLKVMAYSTDAGIVSYSWTRYALDAAKDANGKFIDNGEIVEGGFAYEKIYDSEEVDGDGNLIYPDGPIDTEITYYIETVDGNGDTQYIPATISSDDVYYSDILEDSDMDADKLFVRYATCKATGVGQYVATASNRINASTKTKDSEVTTVPGPEDTIFTPNGGQGTDYVMKASNDYTIVLAPEIDSVDDAKISNRTYQWYKDGELIPEATGATHTIIGASKATDIQGDFTLKVTATRNKADGVTESGVFLVTYEAAIPQVTIPAYAQVNVPMTATVGYEIDYHGGKNLVKYQWFKVDKDNNEIALTELSENNSTYTPGTGITQLKCKAVNTYNGTEAMGESSIVTVFPADTDSTN